MFLTGIFDLDTCKATVIPEDAVVHYMGKDYIFLSKGPGEFQLVEVGTGQKDQGWIEVKPSGNGNWKNTRIVVKGAYALLGKMKNKMEDN